MILEAENKRLKERVAELEARLKVYDDAIEKARAEQARVMRINRGDFSTQ